MAASWSISVRRTFCCLRRPARSTWKDPEMCQPVSTVGFPLLAHFHTAPFCGSEFCLRHASGGASSHRSEEDKGPSMNPGSMRTLPSALSKMPPRRNFLGRAIDGWNNSLRSLGRRIRATGSLADATLTRRICASIIDLIELALYEWHRARPNDANVTREYRTHWGYVQRCVFALLAHARSHLG